MKVILLLILLLEVNSVLMLENYDDYFDPIAYYLLFGNDTELYEVMDEGNGDIDTDDPVFSDGVWTCGACGNITESNLIYSEINDIDTNIDDDNYLQVQVGLSFDNMRCVTVVSEEESEVKRTSGSCSGPAVTLDVANARQFVIKVFKEQQKLQV